MCGRRKQNPYQLQMTQMCGKPKGCTNKEVNVHSPVSFQRVAYEQGAIRDFKMCIIYNQHPEFETY